MDDDDCPGSSTCDGEVCTPIPGLPVGTLMTDIAEPGAPVALVTGTLTAPSSEGTYTLQVTNLTANLVRQGATGDPFWATDAAGVGAVTGLLVTVQDGAPCCGQVPEACCLAGGGCSMAYPDDCADQLVGVPQGPGSTCEDDDDHDGIPNCAERPTIPTLSQWGLVVLALVLLATGKVYFGRHLRAASLRTRG